jgi:two-component system chemotaxis response regulator CheY
MKVLVCEDNSLTLKTVEYSLKTAGYDVLKAMDGDEGIQILNREEVDVLVTDINMPFKKGLELVRYIKSEMQKNIPVIIISGINLKETQDHARELGAVGYLTKPLDLDKLVRMVDELAQEN